MSSPAKSDPMTSDTSAAIATLNIRTTALEGGVNELRTTVNGVHTALSSEIRGISTALSAKIDERGKTPWSIIIGGFAAALSLYAYIDNAKLSPLKDKDADLVAMMRDISGIVRTEMVPARVQARELQQSDERITRLEERMQYFERMERVEKPAGPR